MPFHDIFKCTNHTHRVRRATVIPSTHIGQCQPEAPRIFESMNSISCIYLCMHSVHCTVHTQDSSLEYYIINTENVDFLHICNIT